jgi:hypothetical protein
MANETPIMQFFEFDHLPEHLRQTAQDVSILAHHMDATLPTGAEKSAGLRKLLEAKDCFVRALLPSAHEG